MEPLAFVAGAFCIALVLLDVFETVVVPRPTPGRFRIARHLTALSWRGWRFMGRRLGNGLTRERILGIYAPALVIALLVCWLIVLVLGYGLVLYALRGELRPIPADLGTTIYFAGTSVLTLGFGDVLAAGPLARIVALTAAANGLGVVALVITYLFSLFGSFQRREILIVTLQARAGAPPSAVVLLETYAELGITAELPALFADWERWSAEVLDSHVAYPILGYFRSSHDNMSWISSLGAVLDAATLVTTTIRGVSRAQAELTRRVGGHFSEDISNFIGLRHEGSGVTLPDFAEAHRRLATAGYDLEPIDVAWPAFEQARAAYSGRLEALAEYWAVPAARWVEEHAATGSVVHELTAAAHHHDQAGRDGGTTDEGAEPEAAAGARQ